MQSIFDLLGGMSPEQNQGLLEAAAQMLRDSAPSRIPRSFMQTAVGGAQAFHKGVQSARDRQADSNQRAMEQALYDWKLKDAEADFGHQQGIREKEIRIADRIRNLHQGGGAPGMGDSAAGSFPGPESNFGAPLDSNPGFSPDPRLAGQASLGLAPPPSGQQAMSGAQGPDWMKLGLSPALAVSMLQGGPGRPNMTHQAISRMMAEAEIYASEGDFDRAEKRYKAVTGLMPQVDRIDIATDPNTKQPIRVITFKDGTEQVSAFGAKPEMVEMNLGSTTKWVDKNRLQNGQTYQRTMAPGEAASIGIQRERLRYERERDGRPVYNAEAGGFITPPSRSNPNGGVIPLAGSAVRGPKMTEDQAKATGWLVQAENAWKNMQAVAYDADGNLTDAARPGRAEAMATAVPFGMGEAAANSLRSADRQKFMQGASSLSESLLRAATGAGVNQDEALQKMRELTPVWGDTPEVIQQKMEAVPLYLDSLKVRSGPGANQAANVLARDEQRRGGAGKFSITTPDGRTFNFPDARSLANFKLTTGLK